MTSVDDQLDGHGILLVDGICNFCNGGVNFIIDRDPRDYFRFATIQSPVGELLMIRHGLDPKELSSMVLIEDGVAYRKSAAALRIVKRMGGLWPVLCALVILPPILRDAIYNYVARNRYRFFGKVDTCRVPTPELRAKFLENGQAAA